MVNLEESDKIKQKQIQNFSQSSLFAHIRGEFRLHTKKLFIFIMIKINQSIN